MDDWVGTKLRDSLDYLKKHDKCAPFLLPVDWVKEQLYDYPKIISEPIDISTVQKKLKEKKYLCPDEFWADVNLIWSNCMIYNEKDSEIYKCANYMERKTGKLRKYITNQIEGGEKAKNHKSKRRHQSESEEEEFDEDGMSVNSDFLFKAKLCKRISLLNPVQLGRILKFVELLQPEAVSQISTDPQRVMLDVDRLHSITTNQLMTFVIQQLKNKKK